MLELAAVPLPPGAGCLIPIQAQATIRDGVSVQASRVPWARWASNFVVVAADGAGSRVCVVDASGAEIVPGYNLVGEPRDTVRLENARVVNAGAVDLPVTDCLDRMRELGALARSVQMAAALATVLDISVQYCTGRTQFGRPLSAFQAVQQELAILAGEVEAASAATAGALTSVAEGWSRAPVAVAKIRTAGAAGVASQIAHQLHGAIGITREYLLHDYTLALWSWREEYGPEAEWSAALAEDLGAAGPVDIWRSFVSLPLA
jgi:acyl-CoA dehydrogenase